MSVRSDLCRDIYELCDDIDPSGKNKKRMKDFLDAMNDAQFKKYMKEFLSNDQMNFTFALEPLAETGMTFEEVCKVCAKYDIPIYERIYRPHLDPGNPDVPASAELVLVLCVDVKRLQQFLQNKNHASTSIGRRNPKTGQVDGDDRNVGTSDNEFSAFFAQGRDASAHEFAGFRADDSMAEAEAFKSIQMKGEVSLKELHNDPLNRVATNTIYYYLVGSGIGSNFIEPTGYIAPITLKAKEEKQTTIRQS